jgi:hypothetical protein
MLLILESARLAILPKCTWKAVIEEDQLVGRKHHTKLSPGKVIVGCVPCTYIKS